MPDSTTTRIKLPSDVHRKVKAAAVLYDVRTDEALGMMVAFCVGLAPPLSWLSDLEGVLKDIQERIETDDLPF